MDKRLVHLTKENKQMVNKYTKRSSQIISLSEIQMKTKVILPQTYQSD